MANYLMCSRNNPAIVESIEDVCKICGHKVFKSPASVKAVQESGEEIIVICMECAAEKIRGEGGAVIMHPTSDQIAEMREALKRKADDEELDIRSGRQRKGY